VLFINVSKRITIFNQGCLLSNSTSFTSPRAFPCRLQPEREQSHQQAMSSEHFLANPEFTSKDSMIDREYKRAMYTMVYGREGYEMIIVATGKAV